MTTATLSPRPVTEAHQRQFEEDGYFILESAIPPEHLQLLRDEAQAAIDRIDAIMDANGTDEVDLSRRGKRYFSTSAYQARPVLGEFVFSPLMADICRATLGPEAYLFFNQYVIKCADKESAFSWHQDSGYVGYPKHKPYITCWVALDDVNEQNGTVYLLPYSRLGIRTYVQHVKQNGDMVGYFGNDRGIPAIVPAGSIVVFSSLVFHASSANLTDKMRRAYIAHYSQDVIMTEDGTKPWGGFEQFLKNDEIVWKPA